MHVADGRELTRAADDGVQPPRAAALGKFVHRHGRKFYVRGVTYGTFGTASGYPEPGVVDSDFAAMAAAGINTVRTYTVPPPSLLEAAASHGLAMIVGLPWEQHVAFLDDRARAASIARSVRDGVRACAAHPAVLAYVVGNEIPASIVRWHGRRRVERFIRRLYETAKGEDPEALVTYVNYPSTEYLQLPYLDILAFNVFLEREEAFDAYVARLQNIAGDRPLLLTEIGLDSRRNGEEGQALALEWQLRSAFRGGCAGAVAFSWTDEWERGGLPVDDWDFGLVRRDRSPKPALAAVSRAFENVPFPRDRPWPPASVIVCSHNGAATIGDCLGGVTALEYPSHEVIVVDDGSTDGTSEIASGYGVRLIQTENRGLSNARNIGLDAASGEIVAYVDDDASPDPNWLQYLAASLLTSHHAGVGGPNVPPPPRTVREAALAEAPGGPVHVLVGDREAEHIPGCNMAFWRDRLRDAGGFDPQFRIAGDDVDACWRLHARGETLGFSPGAMVWHRPRPSIRAYLRQQRGYGAAEALLERKWPERYNRGGHLRWAGHVYGGRIRRSIGLSRWRVYYGTWGSGLFQSVYQRAPGTLAALPLMPEWYLLLSALLAFAAIGLAVDAVPFAVPGTGIPISMVVLAAAVAALVAQSAVSASAVVPGRASAAARAPSRFRLLLTALFLLQPAARLAGRLRRGLTPWRLRGASGLALPWPRRHVLWRERWVSADGWLAALEGAIRRSNVAVHRGGDFDRWDLEARVGPLASARLRMAVEEHGQGRQLLRFRVWPVWSGVVLAACLVFGVSLAAEVGRSARTTLAIAILAALVLLRAVHEGSTAIRLVLDRLEILAADPEWAVVDARAIAQRSRHPASSDSQQNGGAVEDFGEAVARLHSEAALAHSEARAATLLSATARTTSRKGRGGSSSP